MTDDDDHSNFVRLHRAIQLVCDKALPCITDTLTKWHSNQLQVLHPCASPHQCPVTGKPKPGKSCQGCVDWGNALQTVYYPPIQPNVQNIQWSNVNPSLFHQDPVEVAKAFVLRLPSGKSYKSVGDFDAASLLMIMMRFGEFHGGNRSVFDKIKEVSIVYCLKLY